MRSDPPLPLAEEVLSETFVGVQKDSVDIIVELGGDILGKELNLVDELSGFGSLGGGGLLVLSVIDSNSVVDVSWLNSGDVEAGSEGRFGHIWGMEQIVKASGGESLMLLVDFSEDDWEHACIVSLNGSLFSSGVVGNL